MRMDKVRGLNHIGIDLDTKNRLRLLISYFNARHLFPGKDIRVYETKMGHHLEILGIKSNLIARMILGDCPDRLWFSEERMRIFKRDFDDVLFNIKDGYKREEVNVFSEAW